MKRVLIVEESRDLRRLLLEMLPALFPAWQTLGADSLEEAERWYRSEVFTLAILDVDYSGPRSGIEVLREWTGAMRRCPVVATTTAHARMPLIWVLNPAEVLLKPWDVHEIRARLARAAASEAAVPPATFAARVDGVAVRPEFAFAGAVVTPDLQCEFPDGHREKLGAKEYGILAAFAHAPQALVLREQLLRDVWGADADTRSNSLNVYVSRLRRLFAEHGGQFEQTVNTEAKVGWRIAPR
jgi:DNA-binding response OmpR family regulator